MSGRKSSIDLGRDSRYNPAHGLASGRALDRIVIGVALAVLAVFLFSQHLGRASASISGRAQLGRLQ